MHHSSSELRKNFLIKRRHLSMAEQNLAAEKLSSSLLNLSSLQNAKHIAGYFASQGEVNLHFLTRTLWEKGISYYLPCINKDTQTLCFLPYQPDTPLKANLFGILEPDIGLENQISPALLDLVLVPLVAVDKKGNRIGMGAGYYDRTFAFRKSSEPPPYLYGIAYTWQIVDSLEPEPWDVRLDLVIEA